ncbi:MAG: cytochrome C [Nitrospinae bacterium CG11_big_fil_rev_8_21_14_0_20_56_8]|nr:MAG: cytochrome C [Nitrospinae bacterium CG11_big_fil_rev_8_21_14_0_20_56_8]
MKKAVFISIFLLASAAPSFADETCSQVRNTPQAPKNFLAHKNPLKPTKKNLEEGRKLYYQERKELGCVQCHGEKGDGQGKMAPGLVPPPQNFSCAPAMNKIKDGQMFWIIQNGSAGTGMYTYAYLKDKEIWQLILYIRQFSKK